MFLPVQNNEEVLTESNNLYSATGTYSVSTFDLSTNIAHDKLKYAMKEVIVFVLKIGKANVLQLPNMV